MNFHFKNNDTDEFGLFMKMMNTYPRNKHCSLKRIEYIRQGDHTKNNIEKSISIWPRSVHC